MSDGRRRSQATRNHYRKTNTMTTIEQLNGYLTDLRNGNSVEIGGILILPKGNELFELWEGTEMKNRLIGSRATLLHVLNNRIAA